MAATRFVWLRVGDGGEYERFDDIDDAVEYLNTLRVGRVDHWTAGGIWTPNYWGHDYISLYWGDEDANLVSELRLDERAAVEDALEENYL